MNHQIFVPVTDDIIYNHPEQIEGPLIPYSAGMECQNWLSIEINPEEGDAAEAEAALNSVPRASGPISVAAMKEVQGLKALREERKLQGKPKLHLAYSAS